MPKRSPVRWISASTTLYHWCDAAVPHPVAGPAEIYLSFCVFSSVQSASQEANQSGFVAESYPCELQCELQALYVAVSKPPSPSCNFLQGPYLALTGAHPARLSTQHRATFLCAAPHASYSRPPTPAVLSLLAGNIKHIPDPYTFENSAAYAYASARASPIQPTAMSLSQLVSVWRNQPYARS